MKKEIKNKVLWEVVGYVGLAMCIFGQITVGYWYLLAQCVYLVANIASVIRSFALELPSANKVKDIFFTAITLGLIVIYFIK
jgi:hypothetical protein